MHQIKKNYNVCGYSVFTFVYEHDLGVSICVKKNEIVFTQVNIDCPTEFAPVFYRLLHEHADVKMFYANDAVLCILVNKPAGGQIGAQQRHCQFSV